MEKFYSKVDTGQLLHIVFRLEDFTKERTEVIDQDQFIQCAALNMKAGKTFRPHKHFTRKRFYDGYIPQESWVVIRGRVKCVFYDTNGEIIATPILYEGDASFTLGGGHTYQVLREPCIVYEYKTGPYFGQKDDKIFIDGNNC